MDKKWTLEQAVTLCRLIEEVCPEFGCHVALTGGTLYRSGARKDCDVLFYRIRQVDSINRDGLFAALARIGLRKTAGFGWVHKGTFNGKSVDMFFPDDDGEYPVEDDEDF